MAFFLSSVFVLVLSASALAEAPKVKEFHICSNKKIIRTIRIDVLEDKTCQTNYTKAGVDKVVGSGAHYESCVRFLGNVKTNLEGAGWNCRKVNSVTMTSSN